MFEKTKDFCKKYKNEIIIVGGVILTAGASIVIIGKTIKNNNATTNLDDVYPLLDDSEDRATLEEFGAIYKEGYGIPFASKEVAVKFLEERGATYQLDILDDETSVIWISE